MSFGTGAGKGDLPRHVDGEAYRNNFDDIFRKKSVYANHLKKYDTAISEGKFDKAAELKQEIELILKYDSALADGELDRVAELKQEIELVLNDNTKNNR